MFWSLSLWTQSGKTLIHLLDFTRPLRHSLCCMKRMTTKGKTDAIEYCLYARKSSESDERQAMSIDSQIKEMQTVAQREELLVKEVREESHSAKLSGQRPVFNQLLIDIEQGEFGGILNCIRLKLIHKLSVTIPMRSFF